jgi:hypothetical protein
VAHSQQPTRRGGPNLAAWIGIVSVIVVAASTVAVIVLGDTLRLAGAESRTLGGRVTLVDTDPTTTKFTWDHGTCAGEGPFADLIEGTSVVVKDEKGTTITVGTLSGGVPARIQEEAGIGETAQECYFPIRQTAVAGRDFYRVQVGRQAESTVAGGEIGRLELRFGS